MSMVIILWMGVLLLKGKQEACSYRYIEVLLSSQRGKK